MEDQPNLYRQTIGQILGHDLQTTTTTTTTCLELLAHSVTDELKLAKTRYLHGGGKPSVSPDLAEAEVSLLC
jgi:hypothetical protein